jgi:5-keto-L-gluconate epimerase
MNDRRDFLKTGFISMMGVGVGSIGLKYSSVLEQVILSSESNSKSVKNCKISARLEMLPGKSVLEQIDNAVRYGFDGISLPGRYLKNYIIDLKKVLPDIPLPLISLSLGFEGSLVNPDKKVREKCKTSLLSLFDLCSELKVKILNMPPVLIKDNPERYTNESVQDELLISQLYDICEEGKKRDVLLLLEPVNRYETEYLTTLSHAVRICNIVNHDHLGVVPDFFHMMMEELSIAKSITVAGKWVKHVHVAENTRVEPGPGSLNFKPGFEALKKIGYNGFIEIECRSLSGDPEIVYPCSIKYLRGIWDSV